MMIVSTEITRKLMCQDESMLMVVPTGTPMMVAVEKPEKTAATSIDRFSSGAITLTNPRISEMITPATAAVMIRATKSQKSFGARAVMVLPIQKIISMAIKTLKRLYLLVTVVKTGVQTA